MSNRIYDRTSKLNLQPFQRLANTGMVHETVVIPADSNAAFSGYNTITIREQNVYIHQLILALTAPAITGMTSGRYVPATFWPSRIELCIGGNVVQTLWGLEQFWVKNLFFDDADALAMGKSEGLYSNTTQRTTLASASNTYFINLKSFIDQCHYCQLTAQHIIQLRITWGYSLADCTEGTGTITSSSAFTACNLMARITRIPQTTAAALLAEMQLHPFTNLFVAPRQFSATLTCSSTSTPVRVTLSTIANCSCQFIVFCVRSTSSLVDAGFYTYSKIAQMNMYDGAGVAILGGSALPHSYIKDVLMREWTLSRFATEDDSDLVTSGDTHFSSSHVYMYSWSSDPISAYKTGSLLDARWMTGNEQMEIQFTATGSFQLDAFAFCNNVMTQSPGAVTIAQV